MVISVSEDAPIANGAGPLADKILNIYPWFNAVHGRATFNISGTKSQNVNVSRLVLRSSLPSPLNPDVKSRMKCIGAALLQLHPIDQQSIAYQSVAYIVGVKGGSGWVCFHNVRGRVRNRKSNSEAVRPRYKTYCSHKAACIVTTNPNRSVLITIITWHFQFHLVNFSILHLKYKYGARRESRFACYSHCYATWCSLTTGIIASKCPSVRVAALVTRYLTPLISACLKPLKFTTMKHIHNQSANIIEGWNVAFDTNDC